jgi:2-iminobutanoate/2-iminopropanoate deaminase
MPSTAPDPGAPLRRLPVSRVLPAPRFHYSPLVVARGFVFVSGLIGLDPATGALAPGGAFGQARQILRNLGALCDEQGWSLEQLVMARIYCADFAQFPDVNRAWEECLAGTPPPARTSIGANGLPLGALVEMEFQLVVD